MRAFPVIIVFVSLTFCNAQKDRCTVPNKAPSNIEKVIGLCQEEIKQTLIAEALEALNVEDIASVAKSRRKRSFFNDDERKIAGCLLQCVFRRKNALDSLGFPTVEGMVNLYTEGIDDKPYVLATIQAVHTCLNKVHFVIAQNGADAKEDAGNKLAPKENGTTCEVAYQVFDCVSDMIQEYCGQTP